MPWLNKFELKQFPNVRRWHDELWAQAAYKQGCDIPEPVVLFHPDQGDLEELKRKTAESIQVWNQPTDAKEEEGSD